MKTQPKQAKQPSPAELQALHQLFQAGRLQQAEATAQSMLSKYAKAPILYNILGLCQQGQGKYREAVASFRKLLAIDPRIAEIHFNLGVLFTQLNDVKEAIASYRKALQLKPALTVAHFNLGTLLQGQGLLNEAAQHYQEVIALEPGFFAALGNLGTILQQQGKLEEAAQCYRRALALNADARGHFNLGAVLYGLGQHEEAVRQFRESVGLDPQFAEAWNSLGETLRDRGEMDEATRCYKKAIEVQPDHDRAKYNLGEYLCLAGRLNDAIPYFEASDFADSKERALQCLYKTSQFELFKQRFDALTANARTTTVLLGTLSTHYATNFHQENPYPFCASPMDYVRHTHIDELTDPDNPLLQELLHDIQHLAIAERKQGRLYYGIQSAGNLLLRSEQSFQQLAALIREKIVEYRQHYAGTSDRLIVDFPREIEFTSSWYLRMKKGGYLGSHIHEEGWISGCVYLKLPERITDHEGSFAYSTDGDDYPRLHGDFPSQIVDVQVGDLVLFPSSLFHHTLPFQSDQERVCVAFDVKPAA
ncbi:tetratricopeptide repeat protein [Methylobacter sp.]|uniref:tetratricopeptide repeat protein n=1 Tax=Methylobacter sp. TaxID=2051955 RepID=UPI003DA367B8